MGVDNTDPKVIGPGIWNITHRLAINATTLEKQKEFINFMNENCASFPCLVCRGHFKAYMENNPLSEQLDKEVDIDGVRGKYGMFIWTWMFHNAVNKRLEKNIMDLRTAFNLYNNRSLTCSKECTQSA